MRRNPGRTKRGSVVRDTVSPGGVFLSLPHFHGCFQDEVNALLVGKQNNSGATALPYPASPDLGQLSRFLLLRSLGRILFAPFTFLAVARYSHGLGRIYFRLLLVLILEHDALKSTSTH